VNYPNSDPLAKENITFPPGAALFVKEIHSTPLKMEKFFSGCSIAKIVTRVYGPSSRYTRLLGLSSCKKALLCRVAAVSPLGIE
jgi:hypothetical protein